MINRSNSITLSLILSIIALLSCSDTEKNPAAVRDVKLGSLDFVDLLLGTPPESYGHVSVTAHGSASKNVVSVYSVDGAISTLPKYKNQVYGGIMTAADVNVDANPDDYFDYYAQFGPDAPSHPTFGGNGVFGIAGNTANAVPAWTTTMYVPHAIFLLTPELSTTNATISKSTGLTLSWNADPNNTLGVGIEIIQTTDMPLPYHVWNTIETDDGEYTITPSDLAAFEPGETCYIGIGRMNFKFVEADNKDYTVYALSYTMNAATFVP